MYSGEYDVSGVTLGSIPTVARHFQGLTWLLTMTFILDNMKATYLQLCGEGRGERSTICMLHVKIFESTCRCSLKMNKIPQILLMTQHSTTIYTLCLLPMEIVLFFQESQCFPS